MIFIQVNACLQTAKSTLQITEKLDWEVFPHPVYWIAASDFFLFDILKWVLRFSLICNLQSTSIRVLSTSDRRVMFVRDTSTDVPPYGTALSKMQQILRPSTAQFSLLRTAAMLIHFRDLLFDGCILLQASGFRPL